MRWKAAGAKQPIDFLATIWAYRDLKIILLCLESRDEVAEIVVRECDGP